jgi:hypothetical protein
MVAIALVISLTASFVGAQFYLFTENVYARIEHGFAK